MIVGREEFKSGEALRLKIPQSLFPSCLPMLCSERNPKPQDRSQKTETCQRPSVPIFFDVKKTYSQTCIQHEKIIGTLPKQIDFQIPRINQHFICIPNSLSLACAHSPLCGSDKITTSSMINKPT